MVTSVIGKALVVAWSFTLTNLGPTPQIVNLGAAPTAANYVPVEMVVRNVGIPLSQENALLQMSFGTTQATPTNVLLTTVFPPVDAWDPTPFLQYFTSQFGGSSIVPVNQDLYVDYSLSTAYPATDTPITVDVLAYPTN